MNNEWLQQLVPTFGDLLPTAAGYQSKQGSTVTQLHSKTQQQNSHRLQPHPMAEAHVHMFCTHHAIFSASFASRGAATPMLKHSSPSMDVMASVTLCWTCRTKGGEHQH